MENDTTTEKSKKDAERHSLLERIRITPKWKLLEVLSTCKPGYERHRICIELAHRFAHRGQELVTKYGRHRIVIRSRRDGYIYFRDLDLALAADDIDWNQCNLPMDTRTNEQIMEYCRMREADRMKAVQRQCNERFKARHAFQPDAPSPSSSTIPV